MVQPDFSSLSRSRSRSRSEERSVGGGGADSVMLVLLWSTILPAYANGRLDLRQRQCRMRMWSSLQTNARRVARAVRCRRERDSVVDERGDGKANDSKILMYHHEGMSSERSTQSLTDGRLVSVSRSVIASENDGTEKGIFRQDMRTPFSAWRARKMRVAGKVGVVMTAEIGEGQAIGAGQPAVKTESLF